MATEDLCLVCADTLDWTGIGPCGHKEACSRCVARVRFLMEDSKCMICKQDNPQVYFTRFMGDYTERPQEFAQQHLQSRAQQGDLYELPEVNGFFDDQDHYKYIKALCSYTHPMVMGATFGALNGLKRRLQEQQKLHFCDLCIKGRKVFISEQVLYSKRDLEKHMRTGDDTGPMAESGFKGHPLCRFCKQRFYDGDELYKHMEGRHEHCFICRKHHPNKFVYYKDYQELEDHFQSQHHPCPHPDCLERKFVVFLEEAELKRHFATEHGSDMNMSRAQRRQALAINIQLNYSREQEAAVAAAQRPGVVIGGGHNLPRRGGGSMRHSRSDGAMAAAVQASLESGQVESVLRRSAAEAQPGSVTFSAEDFPSVSGQGGPGAAPLGTWLGASGSGQTSSLTQDDFPALPNMSRNQRKKQRDRERLTAATLAGRLAASAAPIRVVNRASAAGPSSSAAAAAADSAAAAGSSSSGLVRHSSSTGNLASASSTHADEEADGADSDDDVAPAAAAAAAADDFPALGGGGSGGAATQAHPAWVPVRRARPPRPGQAAAGSSRGAAPPSISDFPSLAAAPTAGRAAAKPSSSSKARAAGGGSSAGAAPAAVSVAAAVSAAGGVSEELKAANKALIERCKAILSEQGFRDFREQSAAFMQGAVAAGAYHEQVVHLGLLSLVPQLAALCPDPAKRAALVAAHKAHLGAAAADGDGPVGGAAAASASRGWVPPEAAMAALQEVEQRGSWACERCTLVNAPNSRACEVCSAPRPKAPSPAASSSGAATAAGKPPSPAKPKPKPQQQQWGAAAAGGGGGSSAAAVVAASLRQASPARAAAGSGSSSAASSPPPPVQRGADSWPSLAGPSGSSSSSSAAAGSSSSQQQQQQQQQELEAQQQQQESKAGKGGKGGKKGTKTSLQELLASGRSHPQNAWSQQQRQAVVAAPAAAPTGQWKAGGGSKLAKKIGAVNDAWSK